MRIPLPSILVLAVLAVSCGGDTSDAGVFNGGGGSSTLTASFVPQVTSPGPESVSMSQDSASVDTVVVDVDVTQTAGLYSASLDVTFDPARVEHLGTAPGTLFESLSGQDPIYLSSGQNGVIVIGVTSTGGAVDVSGTRTLVRLTFRVLEQGSFALGFDNRGLNDDQVQEIPGIAWSSGELRAD